MRNIECRRTAPPGPGRRRRYYNNYSQESRVYTARQWSFIGAPPLGRYPIGRYGRLRERWHACAAAPEQAPTAAATRHPPPAIRRRPVSRRPRPFLVFARPDVRSSSLRVSVSPTPPLRRVLIAADPTAVGDCACACTTQLQPIIHYVTSNTHYSLLLKHFIIIDHPTVVGSQRILSRDRRFSITRIVFLRRRTVAKSCGLWTHFLGRQLHWR